MLNILFSALAVLLAATALAVVLIHIRKGKKSKKALMDYIIQSISDSRGEILSAVDEGNKKGFKELAEKIEQLEKGLVPDYEKSMEAADAVNSFNVGIANLLGYDPIEALQRSREKGGGSK